ncbi:MAG: hypothetical protein ACXABY_32170 [Candidatus Thorarchaeota archaeon]
MGGAVSCGAVSLIRVIAMLRVQAFGKPIAATPVIGIGNCCSTCRTTIALLVTVFADEVAVAFEVGCALW